MLTYVLFFVIFLLFLHVYFKYNEKTRLIRKLPCPKDTFIIGNALTLRGSAVDLFRSARSFAEEYKTIYGWRTCFVNCVNILNPEDIETVMASSKHSEKSKTVYRVMEPWLKEGLLLSKGAKWQHRRKILTPAFHFNILKRYYIGLEENGKRLVDVLDKSKGEAIDVVPVISEYTLSSICETAMGTVLDESSSGLKYKNAVYKLGELFVQRVMKLYLLIPVLFNMSSIGRRTYKHLKHVQEFTKKVIRERKEYIEKNGADLPDVNENADDVYVTSKKKKTAMLDLLLLAQKDGVIDDAGVQEEVDTFMFEGHDTTAAGLTYCLMLLANHKHVQDKIVEELKGIFGDSDREATLEDQSQMKYMESCIKESLRLYPPVPFISRTITEDCYLSGYKIPKGADCHIHIYDLHRREDLFPNASAFDPDRFLPENSIGRHPYAYIPFSAGPRNCIGQRFAIMEMKSCLSAVLRRFDLEPVTKPEDINFRMDLILRSTHPIYVKFVKRGRKEEE